MKQEITDALKEKITLNRVPLMEAEACIAAYKLKAREKVLKEDNFVKGYLVSYKDIVETYGIPLNTSREHLPTFHYMRVYIGLIDPGNEQPYIYKLYLVPVVVSEQYPNGQDQIPYGPIEEGGESMSYVYDFNTPCPNTCDTTSPLYQAGNPK